MKRTKGNLGVVFVLLAVLCFTACTPKNPVTPPDSGTENSQKPTGTESDTGVTPPESSETETDTPVTPPESSETETDTPVTPPESSETETDTPVTPPESSESEKETEKDTETEVEPIAPNGKEIIDNLYHDSFHVTSKVNGNTVSAQSLTFYPKDGFLPVVFASNAGWASTLKTHYNNASSDRWGYEPVGVINGSFFSMTDGTLNGIMITDGRVTCAHVGFSGEMVTFGADGKMRVTKSALDYNLSVNGQDLGNAFYYINKVSAAGSVSDKIYYWDSACGTKSDAPEAGYELLFNKKDNSELSVGGTLVGELVSVTKTTDATKGVTIGNKQFVLYCKTDSPYAASLKDLKPGAQVRIDVNETVAASKEIMENCSSAITNVGWLVKDGVDQTETHKVIGTHSVTLEARWTAFGTKPDGSYVFFTTEGNSTGAGGSVTLRDVARVMMELGCTNVIRMDGGGSSAMYVCNAGNGAPGYVQESSRAVSDCILIVKRTSLEPTKELKDALTDAISKTETLYKKTKSQEMKEALDFAKAVVADKNATEGTYKQACMKINNAISYIEDLADLVATADGAKKGDYTTYAYTNLTKVIKEAKSLLDKNAAKDQMVTCYNNLLYWYNLTGEIDVNVAAGKEYTTSVPCNKTYPDTDNKELTDGKLGDGTNTYSPTWAGFNGLTVGGEETYDFIVDLGEKTDGLRKFSVNAHQQRSWGIQVPAVITIYISDDGKTWKEVASTTAPNEIVIAPTPSANTFTATADQEVSARYIKYALKAAGTFIFISELTAEVHYK